MLTRSLAFALLVTIVVAKIPPYIKICARTDPNLDQCVIESVEGLRGKLREGMPELDVPPLEPLFLKGLPLSNTESFRAHADNVTVWGLTDFKVIKFHDNFAKMELEIEVRFEKIELDADYDISAKVLVPIKGKGPIHIVSYDVNAQVVMHTKFTEKNGQKYIYFSSMTTKLGIKDYEAKFTSNDGDSPISTAINQALDGGRQEILELIKPTLEKAISEKVLELANKVCKNFTYDELHPETL